jgi:dienelactone hydrolase
MGRKFRQGAALMAMLLAALAPRLAGAQEEIPPPAGKGRLVVVLSGSGGAGSIREVAVRIAALGYDVVLFDSNAIMAARQNVPRPLCAAVNAAIAKARQMPNALPGGYGLVGFSLGGGMAFGYDCPFTDEPAVVAAWYPVTSEIKDVAGFVRRLKAPVVMFAGTADEYKFCCMIDKARAIESAAKAANARFELTTYKGAGHAFAQSTSAANYDKASTEDALARTAPALKRYLGE